MARSVADPDADGERHDRQRRRVDRDDDGHDAQARDAAGEHHDPLHELGAFIRAQREIARMSVRKLAEVAGVSNPYLSQIERGIRRPSADILQQLARALRISVESMYVRAGILQPSSGEELTVPEAIERDHALTPDQKQALLSVYRSFVGHDR